MEFEGSISFLYYVKWPRFEALLVAEWQRTSIIPIDDSGLELGNDFQRQIMHFHLAHLNFKPANLHIS